MEIIGSSSSSRKHQFLKILTGDYENKLRIPQAFVHNLSDVSESFDRAILEGPSGKCWLLKLKRTTDGCYFEECWNNFLTDNFLEDNDFLVFRYEGNMQFNVMVFDMNGCQREKCYYANPSNHPFSSSAQPFSPFEQVKTRHDKPTTSQKKEVKKAAESFHSPLPYFVTVVKQSNVIKPYNLTIPVKFGRAYFPTKVPISSSKREEKEDEENINEKDGMWLVLRNEMGDTWDVNVFTRPSQYAISGGWKRFVVDNNLKKGDNLVFELADDRLADGRLVMNVYIHRLAV